MACGGIYLGAGFIVQGSSLEYRPQVDVGAAAQFAVFESHEDRALALAGYTDSGHLFG